MKDENLTPTYNPIILFDGVCNFCNSSINFIIKHDKKGQFKFAPLQGKFGQTVSGETTNKMPESVLLLEGNKLYSHSTAALKIAKKLDGLWPLMYGFIMVPKPLRDFIYKWIAKNRYKWFGKTETCMIPTKEMREKFLD
jgi:predicted DCC family thiol-disulfide oxidoreductase YuxK